MKKSDDIDAIYYQHAGSVLGARNLSARARAAIYTLFMREMRPSPSTTILDVGVSDEEGPETNMLEQAYPWQHNVTCAGLGTGLQLRAAYPEVNYVQIEAGKPFPFEDKIFDICWSNA